MDNEYYHPFYKIFTQNLFSQDNKNMILEPICCILRILLLKYKEEGTKISISNNSIQYNLPGLTQGIMRNISGDTREDLHNLYNPLLKLFEWYPPKDEKNNIHRYLYRESLIGITMLLKSYEKGTIIHHTLQHYKKIINDTFDFKEINKIETIESPLLNNLRDIWKKDELYIIYKMLKLIDDMKDEEKSVYLLNIHNILDMKEKKINNYIIKSSTSYN